MTTQLDKTLEAVALKAANEKLGRPHIPPHRPRGTPKKPRKMIGKRPLNSIFRNPYINHRS